MPLGIDSEPGEGDVPTLIERNLGLAIVVRGDESIHGKRQEVEIGIRAVRPPAISGVKGLPDVVRNGRGLRRVPPERPQGGPYKEHEVVGGQVAGGGDAVTVSAQRLSIPDERSVWRACRQSGQGSFEDPIGEFRPGGVAERGRSTPLL